MRMAQKCKACKAPIEGFFAKISALAGVKKSTKNPEYCNKCENKVPQAPAPVEEKSAEPKDLYEVAAEPTPVEFETTPETAPEATPAPVEPKEEEIVLNTEEPKDLFDSEDNKL